MPRARLIWFCISAVCFALATSVVWSVNSAGDLAELFVLGCGVFFGLAMFSAYMAVQQHRQFRALDRHLHPHRYQHAHPTKHAGL